MKNVVLFLLIILTSSTVNGQSDSAINRSQRNSVTSYHYRHRMDTLYFKEDAIKFAYAYNGGHSLSIGYSIGRLNYLVDMPIPTKRVGPTLSVGSLFKEENLYLSSSLSFSGHFYLLYANIDANYFTNFEHNSMFISPEIGISLIGHLYIGYSRQIPLVDQCKIQIQNQINIGYFAILKKTRRVYYVLGKRTQI